MKIFKNILEQLLKKKNFGSFADMDRLFLKIFSNYSHSVVFIKIQNGVLFIGVKIPQLVAHFTSLKNHILNQFLEEKNVNITDIKFFYYNKIQSDIKNHNKKNQSLKKIYLDSIINKEDIYMIIEKKCYKKEYHDILYKMYIKSCLNEKK